MEHVRRFARRLSWIGLLPVVIVLGALLVADRFYRLETAHHQTHFDHLSVDRSVMLRCRVIAALRPVQHLGAVIDFQAAALSAERFAELAQRIPLAWAPELVALQWIPSITDAKGEERLVVRYGYSRQRMADALGTDLSADPALRRWLGQVRMQHHLALSPWYRAGDDVLVRAVRPVFDQRPDGQGALLGFVAGVYRVDRLLQAAWAGTEAGLVDMWVSDGSGGVPGGLNYAGGTVRYARRLPDPPGTRSRSERIALFGRVWRSHVTARPGTFIASPWPALTIAIGGLAFGGLLAFYLWDLQSRERRIRSLVTQRTEELNRSKLEFETLAEGNPDMIARLDRDLCYLYVNAATTRFFGQPREAFIGKRLGTSGLPADTVANLQRDARVAFKTGQAQRSEHHLATASGERYFEVRFLPEFGGDDRADTLLVVAREITAQKRVQGVLEQMTLHDPLTGVANRRYLAQFIEREWRREARHRHTVALIMADVDHFKAYNDHYGHQQGDECLRQVAHALQQSLRRPADILVRYGGEEFAILLPETGLQAARRLAEKLRQAVDVLRLSHPTSPVSDRVTLSLGVAAMSAHEARFHDLLLAADAALYRAKKNGRNRVEPPE